MFKYSACLLLAFAPLLAGAQSTVNSNLANTATVQASCSLAVTSNINFGAFNALSETNKTATGSFRVACTKGTYEVQVGFGQNPLSSNRGYSSSTCERRMKSSEGNMIQYSVSFLNASGNYTTYNSASNQNAGNDICKTLYSSAGTWPGIASSGTRPGQPSITFTENKPIDVQLNAAMTGYANTKVGTYTDAITIGVVF